MTSLHEFYKALEEMQSEIASTVIEHLTSEESKEDFLKAVGERIAKTIVK